MRIVIALGSRAVSGPDGEGSVDGNGRRRLRATVAAIADVVRANEVVLVHGGASRGFDDALLELELRHALPDRVIASPVTERMGGKDLESAELREVIEDGAVRTLLEAGAMVVIASGLAVIARPDRSPSAVDRHLDNDLTAARLAERLRADLLLLLTDVSAVVLGFGYPGATPIGRITTSELHWNRFPVGSMGPKVEAACRFVDATGGRAAIGSPIDAIRLVECSAGTQVTRDATSIPVPALERSCDVASEPAILR